MDPLGIIMVAAALGTDAFSLATGLAMGGVRGRWAIYFSAVVGIFHIFMPLTGIYLGFFLGRILGRVAAIMGALILVGLGCIMFREALVSRQEPGRLATKMLRAVPGTGGVIGEATAIFLMAGSVSLDALSAGFGLGAISVNVTLTVLIMGLIAGLMTLLGFIAGRRLGAYLGNRAEIIGGLIMVIIGLLMLGEVV